MSPAATSSSRWKLPYIEQTITGGSCPPPFIAITESWLKSYITDAQVEIKNYQVFRSDRPDRVGGGCLLYVHEQLVVTESTHYEDRSNNMVMCYVKSCNTVFATVYRPPGADTVGFKRLLDKLQESIDDISEDSSTPDLYIVGDFNYPDIDWCFGNSAKDTPGQGEDLSEFISHNFLTQVVDGPTRGKSTLDLVLTNVPRYVTKVKVEPTTLSDHHMVHVQLGFNMIHPQTPEPNPIDPNSFRAIDYHKANFDDMNESYSEVNWIELWDTCDNDLDSFLKVFNETVLEISLNHSPKKESQQEVKARRRRGNKHVYVKKRKRRKLNARIRALEAKQPLSSQLPKLKEEVSLLCYSIQEGLVDKLNSRERKAVEKIKKNPKFFFSYAKRLQKTRSTIPVLRDETGRLVDDPAIKAELLQKQYCKVFSNPDNADIEKCLQSEGLPQGLVTGFSEFSFTEEDMIEALKELDPYSAAPDGDIPARILSSCRKELAVPLCILWSESFSRGYIPETLKTQHVTPIYKKGDRADPANYRPVSLTSHVIKTFERVVRKNLVRYLEMNLLISRNQHGFRKKRSCMTQLLSHIEEI